MTVEPPVDEMMMVQVNSVEDKYTFVGDIMNIRDCPKMEAVKWIKSRTNDEVESFVIEAWL